MTLYSSYGRADGRGRDMDPYLGRQTSIAKSSKLSSGLLEGKRCQSDLKVSSEYIMSLHILFDSWRLYWVFVKRPRSNKSWKLKEFVIMVILFPVGH